MKQWNALCEANPTGQSAPAISASQTHQDEVHQERMRRLHNARASQRAARHHRINRVSV